MKTQSARSPRVSIGMPVYNGENYIVQALDSLLTQTYRDFELIICDNASTDRTGEIATQYAARDRRIKYYRSDRNRGGGWNHTRTIKCSTGEYYMLANHDDLRAPEYIEKTMKILDEDPSILLCYSKTQNIDEFGSPLHHNEPYLNFNSHSRLVRFRDVIRMDHTCEPDFGLIRLNVLKRTVLVGDYADSDRVLLAELALRGRFYQLQESLFFRRAHAKQCTQAIPDRLSRTTAWYRPQDRARIYFPHFRELKEYLRVITRVPMSPLERLACWAEMVKWLRVNQRRLTYDLKAVAIESLCRTWKAALGARNGIVRSDSVGRGTHPSHGD